MTWLLDTNIISELTKPQPDAKCEAWLEEHAANCAISTISLSELRFGIERMPEGKKKGERDREFRFLLEDYAGRFFEFDAPSAFEWGRYAADLEAQYGTDWWKHFDLRDTQIAAIGRAYDLIIVTRNVRHFPFCKLENPFGEVD